MMIMEIGLIAGEILNYVEKIEEPFSFDDIKSKIDYPDDLILMSLGWLVREKHIFVKIVDNKYYICCCKNDAVHCPESN